MLRIHHHRPFSGKFHEKTMRHAGSTIKLYFTFMAMFKTSFFIVVHTGTRREMQRNYAFSAVY
jgi:hypothetical protein